MCRNERRENSTIPKCIHLKIRRRDGVEYLTTLDEGQLKMPIDGPISPENILSFQFVYDRYRLSTIE